MSGRKQMLCALAGLVIVTGACNRGITEPRCTTTGASHLPSVAMIVYVAAGYECQSEGHGYWTCAKKTCN